MIKTQKSKLLQSFTLIPLDSSELQSYTALVDMGFFWRLCVPSSEDREKGDETKYTWYDYAKKIFLCILSRHPNAVTIIFVNDPYDVQDSIKGEEHASRSYINGGKNVFINLSDELPNKTDMSKFFVNKSNKIRLQSFLKTAFQDFIISRKRIHLLDTKKLVKFEKWNKFTSLRV